MASERLKKYLIENKDSFCKEVEDIYKLDKQNDFWPIVRDSIAGKNINRINWGQHFHLNVSNLFGDILPNHENYSKICTFFSNLLGDCPGDEVFIKALKEIKELVEGTAYSPPTVAGGAPDSDTSSDPSVGKEYRGISEEDLISTIWSDPQMRRKVLHMRNIVKELNVNRKGKATKLCSSGRPDIKKCQLHTDSIGLAEGGSYYDKYSSNLLFLVDELEKIKQGLRYLHSETHYDDVMSNLKADMVGFCGRVRRYLLDTPTEEQNTKDEDVLNETKRLLKKIIEHSEMQSEIDACFDTLSKFNKSYLSSSDKRLFVKELMCLKNLIQKIQDELIRLIHGNSESLWLAIDAYAEKLKKQEQQAPVEVKEAITPKGKMFLNIWSTISG